MAKVSIQEFAKRVRSGAVAEKRDAVYFLYGSEPRRILDAAKALKKALEASLGGPENYYRYLRVGSGVDEPDVGEVLAQLNTVSMFGGGKLVWLGPIESIDKKSAAALTAYAANPNPASTLIICVAVPKKGGAFKAFDKSALVTSMVKSMVKSATVVRFGPHEPRELYGWVGGRFRAHGLSLDNETTARLVELCGRDLEKLDSEIVKLASYAGDETHVTLADVETAVGDHRTQTIWNMTKAFGRLDLAQSQATLSNLMDNNTPAQMILKILTMEIMRFAAAADHRARWTPELAVRSLRAVLKANMDIMRGGVSPETALNAMLVDVLAKKTGRMDGS